MIDHPLIGDERQEDTLLAVGRALSTWEWMEGNRAVLFAELVFGSDERHEKLTAFGNCMDCGKRIEMIRAAVDKAFPGDTDAILRKRLRKLAGAALNLAGRRNEITHGIVRPRHMGGFALVPAYYAIKKGSPFLGPAKPAYTYRARDIDQFRSQFAADYDETTSCINAVISHRQVSIGATLASAEPDFGDDAPLLVGATFWDQLADGACGRR